MMSNNKRVIKNTLLLYIRMLILIMVQLYTVPIILKALGVTDYGVYNVIGGIVAMFSFVSGSLASGSQRFIAFEIGRGNQQSLQNIFNSTVSIYLLLALMAFLLLEIGDYWFLNTQMNIPDNRMYAANWVFHISVLTFIVNLVSIPYNAMIIAHERMSFFAYISILECLLKLVAVIILQYVVQDKLIVYALFICLIAIIIRIVYQVYCLKKFEPCRHYCFSFHVYKGRELLTYSGWNMIGSIAILSRQQGLNIIMNLFFGPLLNAAHSIAQQINGVLTQFINNIYLATRPQITKYYASDNIQEMWNLVFSSSKFAFYLLTLISIPALLEMDVILALWLHEVPAFTVSITKLMILSVLIETLTNQIIGAYQAANKIRKYQSYSSTIILLNIPLAYLFLKFFPSNPNLPYLISTIISFIYICSILWNAKVELSLDVWAYLMKVIWPNVIVYVATLVAVYLCVFMFPPSLTRFVLAVCATVLFACSFIWLIGLNVQEKFFVKKIIRQKICKNEIS